MYLLHSKGVATLALCSYMYSSFSSLFCLYVILMPAIQFNCDYFSCAYSFISKVLHFIMKLVHFPQSILISSATFSDVASPLFCLALRTLQRTNFLTGCLHFNSSTSSTFSCVIGTTNRNAGCSTVHLFQKE